MSSATESLVDVIGLVHMCETGAAHQLEDRSDKAWDALKKATPLLKSDASSLKNHGHGDMRAVWKFTAARALKKRMITGQCKATLAVLASDFSWRHAATSDDELLAQLRELFADGPEMLEKLRPATEEELAARAQEAEAAPKVKVDPATLVHASDKVKAGWDAMAGFGFTFPVDLLGTKGDDAANAMMNFYQGVQKLSPHDLEWMTREDFGKFLHFAEGMLEKRGTFRARIVSATSQVAKLRPEFQDLATQFLESGAPSPAAPAPAAARRASTPTGRQPVASDAASTPAGARRASMPAGKQQAARDEAFTPAGEANLLQQNLWKVP